MKTSNPFFGVKTLFLILILFTNYFTSIAQNSNPCEREDYVIITNYPPNNNISVEEPGCEETQLVIDFYWYCLEVPSQEMQIWLSFPKAGFEIIDVPNGFNVDYNSDPYSILITKTEEFTTTNFSRQYSFNVKMLPDVSGIISRVSLIDVESGEGNPIELLWQTPGNWLLASGDLLSHLPPNGIFYNPVDACNLPQNYQPYNLFLSGQFEINETYCFKGEIGNLLHVNAEQSSSIIVQSGHTLTIDNADFSSCEGMWQGIIVEDGATLEISNSKISDAINAIEVLDGGTLKIDNVNFSNNFVGILCEGGIINVNSFDNNTFSAPSLKNGDQGIAGIYLSNVTSADFSGIGNIISEVENGVFSYNSSFDLAGIEFNNIFESGSFLPGHGVYARSSGYDEMNIEDCQFSKMKWGIYSDHMNSDITDVNMSSLNYGFHGLNRSTAYISESDITAENNAVLSDDCTMLRIVENNNLAVIGLTGQENKSNTVQINSPGYTLALVRDNMQIKADNAKNALFMQSGYFLRAENNYIDHNYNIGYGINTSGVDLIDVDCNGIDGVGGNDRGFFSIDSDGSVSCNSILGSKTGIEFSGLAADIPVSGNAMTGSSQVGLRINGGGTAIGEQPHRGNLWNAGSIAEHLGLNFQQSRFFTNSNQPPIYPYNLNIPGGDPSEWFDPSQSWATSFVCPSGCGEDFPIPLEPEIFYPECIFTDLDIAIADGSFNTPDVDQGTWHNSKKNLYERLTFYCDYQGNDSDLTNFMNTTAQGNLGTLASVEFGIKGLEILENYPTASSLSTSIIDLETAKEGLKQTLQQLNDPSLTSSQIQALEQDAESFKGTINSKRNAVDSLSNLLKIQKLQVVSQLFSTNESVLPTNVMEENDKLVNRIYLQSYAVDTTIITPGQLDTLLIIAGQCPQEGGEGVLRARALYSTVVQGSWFSDDYCTNNPNERKSFNAEESNSEVLVVSPNPTSSSATIRIKNPSSENTTIEVFNGVGILVKIYNVEANVNQIKVNLSDLPSGLFYLNLMDEKGRIGNTKLFKN